MSLPYVEIPVITRAGTRLNSTDCYVLLRHSPDILCLMEHLYATK